MSTLELSLNEPQITDVDIRGCQIGWTLLWLPWFTMTPSDGIRPVNFRHLNSYIVRHEFRLQTLYKLVGRGGGGESMCLEAFPVWVEFIISLFERSKTFSSSESRASIIRYITANCFVIMNKSRSTKLKKFYDIVHVVHVVQRILETSKNVPYKVTFNLPPKTTQLLNCNKRNSSVENRNRSKRL